MKVTDRNGQECLVRRLTLWRPLDGPLEGNPEELSNDVLRSLTESAPPPGAPPRIFVNTRRRRKAGDFSVLPGFCCTAEVHRGGCAVTMVWFQDPGNPFAALSALCRELDWPGSSPFLETEAEPEPTPLPAFRDSRGVDLRVHRLVWVRSDPEGNSPAAKPLRGVDRLLRRRDLYEQAKRAFGGPVMILSAREEQEDLPPVSVAAALKSAWTRDEAATGSHLTVGWLQDEGDPFERLAQLLRDLDWSAHATEWEF